MCGVSIGDPDPSGSQELAVGPHDEVPEWTARVRIEKEGSFKAEAAVPPDRLPGLFEASIYGVSAIGAISAPALTLNAMPSNTPMWACVTVITGQMLVLLSAIVAVRHKRKQ